MNEWGSSTCQILALEFTALVGRVKGPSANYGLLPWEILESESGKHSRLPSLLQGVRFGLSTQLLWTPLPSLAVQGSVWLVSGKATAENPAHLVALPRVSAGLAGGPASKRPPFFGALHASS